MYVVLTILSCGLVATMLIVAIASSYRIIVETRLKEKILSNEQLQQKKEISVEDNLRKQLEKIREERYSLIRPDTAGAWSQKITTKSK